MKRSLAAVLLALVASSAYAIPSLLVAQWHEGANQMCRYDNGTVLNVGLSLCPLRIGSW